MLCDPFHYEAVLENGTRIHFAWATITAPGWIHLEGLEKPGGDCPVTIMPNNVSKYIDDYGTGYEAYPRGIEVQISKIISLADAPHGS